MSYRLLDANGRPLPRKGRISRVPAVRREHGRTLNHYEITCSVKRPDGKWLQMRRRAWLADDAAAILLERELKRKPPAEALTWIEAHRRWIEANRGRFSPGHIANVAITIRQWTEAFGVVSTIEDTALPAFAEWVEDRAKEGKGRGAQIKFGHLMAMARWCRKRGFIQNIPFEHAPKPEARLSKRHPAGVEEYHRVGGKLPPHMSDLWRMLGLTGMRISAACDLLETDIDSGSYTVTTKGRKRVEYPITPGIREIIESARRYKAEHGFKAATVFCNSRGRKWDHTAYSKALNKELKRMGLGVITPHQLRHLVGTIMAESNLSPDMIQAGLGHDSRVSAESYIDQTAAMRKTALEAVARKMQENDMKFGDMALSGKSQKLMKIDGDGCGICPCCGSNILTSKE